MSTVQGTAAVDARVDRLTLLVWATGMAAYIVAVAGRTSLGVAGLQAADRFGISAATLASFSVVQLAVYAAAQLPAGMVLDRVGPRALLTAGATTMSLGQLLLALVDTVPLALLARVLIGLGDGAVLVTVLALVPVWFRPRLAPVVTQMTGILGQLGQVVSAVPFLAVLLGFGWTPAFGALAVTGLIVAVVAAVVVRDRQPTERSEPAQPADGAVGVVPAAGPVTTATVRRGTTSAVLREPGVWLGFFTHLVTLFPTSTFLLLWGVPFLTVGQGVSTRGASVLLIITTVAAIVLGPLLGELVARFPQRRSWLVLGVVAVSTAVWTAMLLPSTARSYVQLVVLVVVVAAGMITCTVGFDYARTFAPAGARGTAIGLVNIGGYSASVVAILLFGFVLDVVRPSGDYVLQDFRLAFAAQAPILVLGVVGLLVARTATVRRWGVRA